jgi:sialate O-acetylesterase
LAAAKPAPAKPKDLYGANGNPNRASVLYNGMIAPVVPFAAKGAIWYQGESNAGRAEQYRKLLPAMIQSWREAWGNPQFAFHIVQLANFQNPPKEPGESDWAELREAQWLTAQQPHNGIALAIDLADREDPTITDPKKKANSGPRDIHPRNKQDVGRRLALVALARTYGKSDVAHSGPVYDSMKVDGNKARITFKFADGLAAKGGDSVQGFQIAGEDKAWHWAEAKIDGDGVTVWSDKVSKPAAVRYNWAINPQGNLYNKADLPAAPFRTDDWPGVTAGKK